MNLRKCDAGKVFIAPSGRLVSFEAEKGGVYMFTYLDDPTDGLALSFDGLRILERARELPCDAVPITRPIGVA